MEINNWAAQFNLQKKDTEGPLTWLERVTKSLPDRYKVFNSDIKKAFDLWIQVSYESNRSDGAAKQSLSEIRKTLKVIT